MKASLLLYLTSYKKASNSIVAWFLVICKHCLRIIWFYNIMLNLRNENFQRYYQFMQTVNIMFSQHYILHQRGFRIISLIIRVYLQPHFILSIFVFFFWFYLVYSHAYLLNYILLNVYSNLVTLTFNSFTVYHLVKFIKHLKTNIYQFYKTVFFILLTTFWF